MKVIRILFRSIRDSFKSIIRNFSLSLASISCITITLVVVALSMLLSVNVNDLMKKVEDDVTIVAFLERDITLERIAEIEEEIRALPNIQPGKEGIKLDSKENIRKDMMESSSTYDRVLKSMENREDNPLRDAYHVKVEDINEMDKTVKQLSEIEGVYLVRNNEEMVNSLVGVFDAITKGTYIVVIALVIVTAFLIVNTIKITIFSRKREIDIMRLVGASNINIKIPFLFEGLFLGVLGSIIPIIITIYGYTTLYNHFDGKIFGNIFTLTKPNPFIYQVSFILLLIGVLVGMLGSWRAVKKHLKI